MNILRMSSALSVAASIGLASCGGGGGGIGGTGGALGTLRLAITDAPSCGFDADNITIEKVRVNQRSDAADGDAGWSEIVLSPVQRIDFSTLSDGVLRDLGQTSLPAGKYTPLRLVLAANSAATTPANSVIPTGSPETALTTPSAQQSGLKLNTDIDVASDPVADFVLDFDACKSVVKRGNSGQYILKPVISVIPRLSDAGMRVAGYVDPPIASGANVSLQSNGVPVKGTIPDANGQFVLYLVPTGTYDLVVTSAGHLTTVMTGIPVVATAYTCVNSPSLVIAPSLVASAPRVVAGTVSPPSAAVRALQVLTGGPTIEAAWMPVDAATGAFAAALPTQAPVRAAYVAGATAPVFTADAVVGGGYTIEATSAGIVQGATDRHHRRRARAELFLPLSHRMNTTFNLALTFFAATSAAAQTSVGVSIGINQPGVYGRVDIGALPPPPLVFARPIIVAPPRVAVRQEPLYVYAPPGHQKHWSKHCAAYSACGQPVYFVQEQWIRERYEARDDDERRGHKKEKKEKKEKKSKNGHGED